MMAQAQANEQTANAPQPIVKGAGDSAVTSFDELEALETGREIDHTTGATDGREQFRDPDELAQDEVRDEKQKKKSGKKEKEEEDGEEEESVLEEKTDTEKAAELLKNTIKAKVDGKNQEIKRDAKFTIKVKNEQKEVSLQDLIDNFSGDIKAQDFEKKYNELNQAKQRFESDKQILQGYVNDLHKMLMVKKDPLGAIGLLAEAMGGDPVNVVSQFQEQIMGRVDEFAKLSPEQRRQKALEDRLALHEKQRELAKQADVSRREEMEIKSRVDQVMKQNEGLDQATFVTLYNELREQGVSEADLTPEMVGERFAESKTNQSVAAMLEQVNPNLPDKDSAVTEFKNLLKTNPEFTIEDLRDIAVEVYGSKRAKTLSKKLKQAKPAQTAGSTPQRRANPVSFDDLD